MASTKKTSPGLPVGIPKAVPKQPAEAPKQEPPPVAQTPPQSAVGPGIATCGPVINTPLEPLSETFELAEPVSIRVDAPRVDRQLIPSRDLVTKDEPPAPKLYRVWANGTLQRNGVTYQPGDVIELPEHIASKLCCLTPCD